jgi:hypothetical protein
MPEVRSLAAVDVRLESEAVNSIGVVAVAVEASDHTDDDRLRTGVHEAMDDRCHSYSSSME